RTDAKLFAATTPGTLISRDRPNAFAERELRRQLDCSRAQRIRANVRQDWVEAMKNCINEGALQAWFDGELDADEAANVAAHLNACLQCAEAARAVEAENLILSEGL